MKNANDFVSPGVAKYPYKLGKHVASSLSGFIAGVVVSTIIWLAAAYVASYTR